MLAHGWPYARHASAWFVVSDTHGRNPRSPIVASGFVPWQRKIVFGLKSSCEA